MEGERMNARQHLDVSDREGVTVVRFRDGRLVAGTDLAVVWRELLALLDENRDKLVLDFSLVEFLASEALERLISLRKKLAARKGVLKLCCLCPQVREVFAVTKLDSLFSITKTQAEAIAAFACDKGDGNATG